MVPRILAKFTSTLGLPQLTGRRSVALKSSLRSSPKSKTSLTRTTSRRISKRMVSLLVVSIDEVKEIDQNIINMHDEKFKEFVEDE